MKPEEIVPEYRSRNPAVRWLFHERLEAAVGLAALDASSRQKVLDLGCGEGLLLRRLKAACPGLRLYGADHNPDVVRLNIPGATLFHSDITRPGPFTLAPYDRIFCLDVLEHIKDLSVPLESIRESLSDDGLLVISAPTENIVHKTARFLIKGTFSEKDGPASSPHYHRAATLSAAIEKAGFEPLESRSLPLPGPLAMLRLFSFRKKSRGRQE